MDFWVELWVNSLHGDSVGGDVEPVLRSVKDKGARGGADAGDEGRTEGTECKERG